MDRDTHILRPSDCFDYKVMTAINKKVNELFDLFESRTCENCRHVGDELLLESCPMDSIDDIKTFGCNKWEHKQ